MIIDYDHNPNTTTDEKLQSLKESVQMALNEIESENARLRKIISESGFISSADVVYCTCSTLSNVAAKEAVLVSGDLKTLTPGTQVIVKFDGYNMAASPTLKVGNTPAKDIMRYGQVRPGTTAASSWNSGSPVLFVYDGTYWQIVGFMNTTYSGMTDAEYQGGTSTTNRLITPARLKAAIQYWIAHS